MTDALPFSVEPTRRDMLFVATGAAAVIAAGFSLWPLVANMNPDASTRAAGAPLDVDIGALAPGQMVSVRWRGLPVFIINRPEAALRSLRDPALLANLRDPESAVRQQPDYARNWSRSATPQLGVYVAICTHLGCIPLYYPEPSPSEAKTPGVTRAFCEDVSFDNSQRNVVVLLPGVLQLLVAEHVERARDALARGVRLDHIVDIAALGRHERGQEAVLVFFVCAAIFSASPISARKMISTAPLAPITAICAVGQA
jgi:ubiquinol-cytochrome c reductase iron-sulfur subunit